VDEREPISGVHGLPTDSDLGDHDSPGPTPPASAPPAGADRPAHLQWPLIALVALGGAVGTAAREALTLAFPVQTATADGTIGSVAPGLPLTVGVINVGGAFALGILLAALATRGADVGRRRALRLTFGTGVLGGFTTYSALAADTAGLLTSGSAGQQLAGAAYAVGSIVIGGAASGLGMWFGSRGAPHAGSSPLAADSPAGGPRPAVPRERAGDS
jgi:CrcB protein